MISMYNIKFKYKKAHYVFFIISTILCYVLFKSLNFFIPVGGKLIFIISSFVIAFVFEFLKRNDKVSERTVYWFHFFYMFILSTLVSYNLMVGKFTSLLIAVIIIAIIAAVGYTIRNKKNLITKDNQR